MAEQPESPKLDATASIRFPPWLAEAAERLAERDGMSTSAWIRKVVDRELAARPGACPACGSALPVAADLDGPTVDGEPSGEAGLSGRTGRAPTGGPDRSREHAGMVAGEGSDGSDAEAAEPHMDLLEMAWGVIANAGWDGMAKTTGWQEAAERWRDDYHRWLDLHLRPGGYQTWEQLALGLTRERDALFAEVAELRRAAEDVAGAVPALPLAAALDREAVREIVKGVVADFTKRPGSALRDRITDALWPLLEHAQEAAAGSYEGIRLWMLDCGELVAKHRERAVAAEGKLAAIAALEPWETCGAPGADLVRVSDIAAIISGEGDEGRA